MLDSPASLLEQPGALTRLTLVPEKSREITELGPAPADLALKACVTSILARFAAFAVLSILSHFDVFTPGGSSTTLACRGYPDVAAQHAVRRVPQDYAWPRTKVTVPVRTR